MPLTDRPRRDWTAASVAILVSAFALAPGTALALLGTPFDSARPLEPQQAEAGGAFSFGDSSLYAFGQGRLGVLTDLELQLRAGVASVAEQAGFGVEGGGKFRFLRTEDTGGAVDVAFVGYTGVVKTRDVFVFGLDPVLLVSRHFPIDGKREVFVGAGVGAAFSWYQLDGDTSDAQFGLLGALSAGVDVIERLRFSLEGRLRDDGQRLGLGVTWLF